MTGALGASLDDLVRAAERPRSYKLGSILNASLVRKASAFHDNGAIDFSPSSGRIARAGTLGTARAAQVQLWGFDSTKPDQILGEHGGAVTCIAWSPKSNRVASGSLDTTIKIWDPSTGALAATLRHGDRVREIAWSPSGHLLASIAGGCSMRLWDAALGKSIKAPETRVNHVSWSPGGEALVCTTVSGGVEIWDVKSGESAKKSATLVDGSAAAEMWTESLVAWSPKGGVIAVVNTEEGVLRLWRAKTGKMVKSMKMGSGCVLPSFLKWSPGGLHLLIGSSLSAGMVYDVASSCMSSIECESALAGVAHARWVGFGRLATRTRHGEVDLWCVSY